MRHDTYMFDSRLPISFYKQIAVLNEEHRIYIVQHIETGKIYVEKIMSVYNINVYEQLFRDPIRNIPRIYAICENNNTLTVIEEYISGETLQEVLAICGPIPEEQVIDYTCKLCDILSDIHSLYPAIVHRDIKPSNLILTEDERIVLIDLNAARQDTCKKSSDTRLIGTDGFAAPEQFGFGSSTPQTDIYATGVLMNTLLTGSISTQNIYSGRTGSVIRKCLQLDPKERYPSATQLKIALRGRQNLF